MAGIRRLHIRRFADIVVGSMLNGAKTKVQQLALRKSLDVSKGQKIFNDTIRNNSPTIYLVDPDLISKVVLQTLSSGSKFVKYLESPQGRIQSEDKEFLDVLQGQSSNILGLQETLSTNIQKALHDKFGSITVKDFENIVKPIFSKLLDDMKVAEEKQRTYISFQIAASRAGAELRRQLNNIGISILADAETIISNLSNRVPFVGYRFTGAVADINKVVQKAVVDTLKDVLAVTEDFSVGNLVHAGHVGIYSDRGLLGINMPFALIGGLTSNKFEEIENAIGNIPIHVEQGIRLRTEYASNGGMLLDLQFNFAVSMPEALNSRILGPKEVSAIKTIVGNISTEALQKALKDQVAETSLLELAKNISASPSFLEFAVQAIADTFNKKNTQNLKHTVSLSVPKVLSRKSTTNPKLATTKKVTAPPRITIKTIVKPKVSSVNLLAILQAGINEQVAKNMGTGSETRILNYRTGRFAESVSVSKISESRQGMISVFYSYMKNPYATFSEGGRQQYPKTRDPKLLISRSIRDIAIPIVGNRLRSVVV